MARLPRKTISIISVALICTLGFVYILATGRPYSSRHISLLKNLNVAVIEDQAYHDEVMGAVLYDLLGLGIKPTVYRTFGFRYKFEQLIRRFYPYDFTFTNPQRIVEAVQNVPYDLVVLNTCQMQLKSKPLFAALLDNSTAEVACIVHWAGTGELNSNRAEMKALANAGRLHFIFLSDHTAAYTLNVLREWAEQELTPEWDKIPAYVIVPIYPTANETDSRTRGHTSFNPSRFVIQGNFEPGRRAYEPLFEELVPLMKANLSAWGYHQIEGHFEFIPLTDPDSLDFQRPFTLHLVGQPIGDYTLKIPAELSRLVHTYENLDYPAFYETLSSMDVLLPAFAHEGYFTTSASSSMSAALMSQIPVLGSTRLMRSYEYLAPPAVIRKPNSMSDAKAIELLRLGRDPMEGMATGGEATTHLRYRDWDSYLESIYERNAETWRSIMSGIQRGI